MAKKMTDQEKQHFKTRLMMEMYMHVGRSNIVSEAALFSAVFEKPCNSHDIARPLRSLITELRRDGVAICSSNSKNSGGYWLASAGSELNDYCQKLRIRALKVLGMEAKIRKMTLPDLMGQVQLDLRK